MNAAKTLAILGTAVCAAAASAVAAEKRPFKLYQGIIDLAPFGPPPEDPSVDPSTISRADAKGAAQTEEERAVEKEQEELERAVSVSVMNISPDGKIMVGFTDATQKPPANHYLAVGVQRNGWTVKSADPAEKTVVLEKDGIEIERTVGKAPEKGSSRTKAAPVADRRKSDLLAHGGGASLRSRRAQKEADREAELAERKAMRDEILRQKEEENARREEERAEREAERDALRENLLNIQDELRRNRELKRLQEKQEEESAETEEEGE